jgi:hypothetical protein
MSDLDKRQIIIEKLSSLMPGALQPVARLFAERALSQIPDENLDNLLSDVDNVPELIANQDTDSLFNIARKYGASEEQISQVASGGIPLFPTSVLG